MKISEAYKILGLPENCDDLTQAKKAFKTMALKYHPDKASLNNLTVEQAEAKFKELGMAFNKVKNRIEGNGSDDEDDEQFASFDEFVQFFSSTFDDPMFAFMESMFDLGSGGLFSRHPPGITQRGFLFTRTLDDSDSEYEILFEADEEQPRRPPRKKSKRHVPPMYKNAFSKKKKRNSRSQ